MDDLPPPLLLEILSRLADSADVARCRVSSRAINSLAPEIRSVNLHCSYCRYAKSRSPLTSSSITPFKDVFNKLISELRIVETVSIGVEKPLRLVAYDDVDDEDDDLFLSDVDFVRTWLPKVCGDLRSILISDFWVQSCWRRSDVLALISSYCLKLLELEIKNAWLSVDGLTPMPKLTTLTLEFIRLDDENLEKVNECFPCLQILNLIGVGGLKEPTIHLMHLQSCQWILSNAPISISIVAPSLVKLTLRCVKPNLLLIDTPTLSDLSLSFESVCNFKAKEFPHLKKFHIESTRLRNVLSTLPFGRAVKNLTAVSTRWEVPVGVSKSVLELLAFAFPNVSSLTLTSGVWSELEAYPGMMGGLESRAQMKGLRDITVYLTVNDVEVTVSTIFSLLDNCIGLTSMAMFVHRDVVSNVTSSLISRCIAHCVRVRWKWGMWKEGTKDAWISDGI
ncbi:F-box/LRR-repeat protein at4g29420 [Phtheirospermum japonicum]|uniref:F-box/LRR-repeat protein at4g29420 n=1 Tax=Phtheirospermum japonicum TaxID=374723 RepID=A0A830CVL3_9LAMI|nr:F-box/LRR-repeat protein at4g29420 [Phtheirospermum japonicum]